MHALAAHGTRPKKDRGRRWWLVALGAIVVLAAAAGAGYAVASHRSKKAGGTLVNCAHGATCSPVHRDPPLTVASTTPADGAQGIATDADLFVKFSQPLAPGGPTPSITPPVTGSWQQTGKSTLLFVPSAPFIPFQKYTLTVPGGAAGIQDVAGSTLGTRTSATFTVAAGSALRLEQLLALADYLPLSFVEPPGLAPQEMAQPQPGTLTWKWPGTPPSLMDVWAQGQPNIVTKGAVMSFESQNGLSVDGVAGPQVWSTLLADVATGKVDPAPYAYVLVTKTLPQHLTMWVNGSLHASHVLVNTGVHGATTADGTFTVFEHVTASEMKGTNVTGSTYDDKTVPWASYFNGGDALHGFPRASYGFPQSNGCVEMNIATAGALWPSTPVGTPVTVIGPPS
ncbi:MAG: Ig-like domain-containing protein [Acidimicrobiales bacterium]